MNWKEKKKWMIKFICEYIEKNKIHNQLTGDALSVLEKNELIKMYKAMEDDNKDHREIYEAFAHYKYSEYLYENSKESS